MLYSAHAAPTFGQSEVFDISPIPGSHSSSSSSHSSSSSSASSNAYHVSFQAASSGGGHVLDLNESAADLSDLSNGTHSSLFKSTSFGVGGKSLASDLQSSEVLLAAAPSRTTTTRTTTTKMYRGLGTNGTAASNNLLLNVVPAQQQNLSIGSGNAGRHAQTTTTTTTHEMALNVIPAAQTTTFTSFNVQKGNQGTSSASRRSSSYAYNRSGSVAGFSK